MTTNIRRIDAATREILDRIEIDDDMRRSYAALRAHMKELREQGAPVPEELTIAERQLVTELSAQSQGR